MRWLAIPLMVLALAACGGQEDGTSSAAGEGAQAPAVEAGGALDQAAELAAEAAVVAPVVQECLDLVKAAKFSDAVPVCLNAVQQNPESAEAKAALDQAQEAAAQAQALEAASESLDEAAAEAEAAAGEAEEAKEGLLEGVRQ